MLRLHKRGSTSLAAKGTFGVVLAISCFSAFRVSAGVDPPLRSTCSTSQTPIALFATLAVARSAHTATWLPSGLILIAGGKDENGRSRESAEFFDPHVGSTELTINMVQARYGHTATPLHDGRVLFVGGHAEDCLFGVEIYDPDLGTFTGLEARLGKARGDHTATRLMDGRVLIAGGVGERRTSLGTAEVFDPATDEFGPITPMVGARASHTATLLADGRVLIVGGYSGRGPRTTALRTVEIFDPRTNRFTLAVGLVQPRQGHDAVQLTDGRVIILGGSDQSGARGGYIWTEVFDPVSGVFVAGAPLHGKRHNLRGTSVVLASGCVLVAGGARQIELYDPAANRFERARGDMGGDFSFATATMLPDGMVVIVGGSDSDDRSTGAVWRYQAPRDE